MINKRIVITGGAGFIGSNLAWSLCDANEVLVIDDLSTGRLQNITPLIQTQKIRFLRGRITDLQLMKKALVDQDIVFHEAAIPSVPRSVADPLATNEAGVTGTLVTLKAAAEMGVKRFVSASSSSIYGDTPTLPKYEYMPMNPISPYAATKAAAETYCRIFERIYGLSTVSLRYFNVYGPRQDPASQYAAVIPRFITNAVSGDDLIIYGNGQQTRDFTYVNDVVRANILAAAGRSIGTYNIASGRQITIHELATSIISILKSKAKIRCVPARSGDILHSLADISKAKEAFGYAPGYSIEQGLKATVKWLLHEARNVERSI